MKMLAEHLAVLQTPTPESEALARRYGMEPAEYTPEIPAAVFLKSFTIRDIAYQETLSSFARNFLQIGEWNNGFRAVWVNTEERAIFTYCEGDLDLTIDADDETFSRRMAAARAFYEGGR